MRTIYLNGEYCAEDEAKVSIFDRGFLFSDAVYEVVSVIEGKFVDFAGHAARLKRSLGELSMKGAPSDEEWLAIFRQLIRRNNLSEGVIYLQVTRGNPGDRSFLWPEGDAEPTILAFTQEMSLLDNPAVKNGISIVTLPDLRWGRADIKTTQLLYGSMMKMEAKARGVDDAWLVRDDMISEGTSQNAHIVTKKGVLVTRQLDRKILPGITRAAVLELADGMSLRFEERAFSVEEAKEAAEAFVSSASAFVLPVTQINGASIGDGAPGKVSMTLRKAYIAWARENAI